MLQASIITIKLHHTIDIVEQMKRTRLLTRLFWSNKDKLAVGVRGRLAAAYESERRKRKITTSG
jgi:hypothetical protein